MNGILRRFKNFGMLELLVVLSALYIAFMLGWTVINRSGSEEKAQIVRENHKKIVELINSEINECDRRSENSKTVWGDPCKSEWIANNIIKYVAKV
jgi:sensor domain CHASE-containing protein